MFPAIHMLSVAARPRFSAAATLAMAVLAAVALTACNGSGSGPTGPSGVKASVSVVTVHPQSVTITTELPGRTVASLVAEVRPQVSGIIQKRLFKEGSEVKEGDPLYQIDASSYQASYDSAVADLQKADAAVPNAQAKVDRYQGLISQNAVSKQDLDDAVASLAQAKADVASAKASVETAKINLDNTMIRAPISGRVDNSALTEGALVTANQDTTLTTIRTLDPINVDVTQSSTNLLNLRQAIADGRIKFTGPDVSVKLELDNGTIYSQTGKLAFAEFVVSETTGTFTVRAEFPNPDRILLPGMYVRALVEEGVAPNSFLAPQRAVTHNSKGEATALVVDSEGKVEERTLTISRSIGSNWLVTAGIGNGDRIVVEGSQFVHVGEDVNATEVVIDANTGEVSGPKDQAAPTSPAATTLPADAAKPDSSVGK